MLSVIAPSVRPFHSKGKISKKGERICAWVVGTDCRGQGLITTLHFLCNFMKGPRKLELLSNASVSSPVYIVTQ
jgi:hypothetical protein